MREPRVVGARKGGRGRRQGERVAIAGEERARGRWQRTSRKHGDAVEGVDGGHGVPWR
jgi:hypothetical protein